MASDRPVLVLVHGAGANGAVWEPVRASFAAFDVLAPSLPGRPPAGGAAFERASDAAAWLDAHLAALGHAGVIVVGHSYGGALAIELALLSTRVLGIVVIASGAKLRVHPTILTAALEATRGGPRMSTEFAFGKSATRETVERYERAASATPPEATLADWRACDGFDRLDAIERIAVPALVVAGAADPLTRLDHQRALAARLPRGELVVIEDAGHMLAWERPSALAAAVEPWLARVGLSSRR